MHNSGSQAMPLLLFAGPLILSLLKQMAVNFRSVPELDNKGNPCLTFYNRYFKSESTVSLIQTYDGFGCSNSKTVYPHDFK